MAHFRLFVFVRKSKVRAPSSFIFFRAAFSLRELGVDFLFDKYLAIGNSADLA